MGTDSGFVPVIVTDGDLMNGHGGIGMSIEDRQHQRQAPRGSKARGRPTGTTRRLSRAAAASLHDEVLHPTEFAEAVHRETRRSERSKAPLSMVQYTIDEASSDEPEHFAELLDVLRRSMRETDVLGHTGMDALSILCPDTDSTGAKGLMAKLAPLLAGAPVSCVSATYPEHLFERLTRESSANPAFVSLILPRQSAARAGTYPLKRALDIFLALLALTIFGPLMLATALAIKLTSSGPVIFRQPRLGRGGAPFTFYKFRSMTVDGDDRIHREFVAKLIKTGDAGVQDAGATSYKLKADPRVTAIGRLIRMTSVDELPQLFNVLKGDMSMVGPRPPIPYEAAHYEPWHLQRVLSAKPGITGLWQVDGRSRVTFSDMVRMDLRYIRNCSLMLDLQLLVRTVAVVLRCDGAR